tara:strand:- start:82 stop:990 length:909 start_codon:yes stop_codon:yes gene_type:complete
MNKRKLVIEYLQKNIGKKFTDIELALNLMEKNEELKNKLKEQTKNGKKKPEAQFAAEISAMFSIDESSYLFDYIARKKVDKRWYYFGKENTKKELKEEIKIEVKEKQIEKKIEQKIKEEDLYEKLITYLKNKNIKSIRIDEKKSSNNRGKNGNKWLHPDIVGFECISNIFDRTVQHVMSSSGDNILKCFSYEVKLKINATNLREYYFQAVSNSSWANEAYLVCTDYEENIMEEFNMLSQRHGIGLIWLNLENINKSKIIINSKTNENLDWSMINRLAKENPDFMRFVEMMGNYYDTKGRIVI